MDIVLRVIAVIIELLILIAISYSILNGVRLAALDIGIRQKYNKILTMALSAVGFIVLVFFIAHLTTFYPAA